MGSTLFLEAPEFETLSWWRYWRRNYYLSWCTRTPDFLPVWLSWSSIWWEVYTRYWFGSLKQASMSFCTSKRQLGPKSSKQAWIPQYNKTPVHLLTQVCIVWEPKLSTEHYRTKKSKLEAEFFIETLFLLFPLSESSLWPHWFCKPALWSDIPPWIQNFNVSRDYSTIFLICILHLHLQPACEIRSVRNLHQRSVDRYHMPRSPHQSYKVILSFPIIASSPMANRAKHWMSWSFLADLSSISTSNLLIP